MITEEKLRRVLRDHWPTVVCDHETKTDRAQCSCCTYEPPNAPSVGAAVDTWIDHVIETLRAGQDPSEVSELAQLREAKERHLALIQKLSQTVPLESEVAEALDQRGVLLAEIGTLRAALTTISGIRDSIVGCQSFNFSEHAYPLVAALDAAGFKGAGYEIAHKNLGTLLEQIKAAEEKIEELKNAGVPTILYCPKCDELHVDRDEWASRPHRTHECQTCKHLWRPYEVATYGCEFDAAMFEEIKELITKLPPAPGTRCDRCHHTAPNPEGCARCAPEILGERVTAGLTALETYREAAKKWLELKTQLEARCAALEKRLEAAPPAPPTVAIIEVLIKELLGKHPLPWKIEHDWTVELHDAKGAIIIKVMTDAIATALISLAEEAELGRLAGEQELKKVLAEHGIVDEDGAET